MAKILILDDDISHIETLGEILKSTGHEVVKETKSKNVFNIAQDQQPDIILADINMPEMDGFELAQLLKSNDVTRDISVIFHSATETTGETFKRAIKIGVEDYIRMPAENEEIIARVKVCLDRRKDIIARKKAEEKIKKYANDLEDAGSRLRQIINKLQEKDQKLSDTACALKASVEEWQKTFDSIPDLIFVMDSNNVITKANVKFTETFKLDLKDIIGKKCYKVFHKLDKPWPDCPFEMTIKDKIPRTVEVDDRHIGIPLLVTTAPILNEKKEIVGAIHTAKDIKELKKMEDMVNRINECFLSFGVNLEENIKKIVKTAGLIFEGACALYNKEDNLFLCTEEGWNVPEGFKRKDRKEGHICHDVITMSMNEPFVISNLDKSFYAKTDPNVVKYKLKTYIGCAVKIDDKTISSLCVVFHENKTFNSNELKLLGILAKALGIEEERKKAEDELRKSEERFRYLFDNVRDGIVLADGKTMKFFMGNRMFCEMLGYTDEEVSRLGVNDIHPKEDLPHVVKQFTRLARGEIKVTESIPVKRKDGSVFYADISVSLITFLDKENVMGVFRDITERRKIENALRESEQKYRNLVENLKEGIYSTMNGIFTGVNKAMCNITGYSERELIGMPAWNLAKSEIRQNTKNKFFEMAKKKDFQPVFIECIKQDGSTIFLEVRISGLSHKGEVYGLVIDATDHKHTQDQIAAAMEYAHSIIKSMIDTLIVVGPDARIKTVNKATVDLLGYGEKELIGKPIGMILEEEEEEEEVLFKNAKFKKLIKRGFIADYEMNYKAKSGKRIPVNFSGSVMKGKDDRFLGIVGIARDIREKKKAEEKIRLFSNAVANAYDNFIIADMNGKVTYANQSAMKVFGYAPNEITNLIVTQFTVNPEDAKQIIKETAEKGNWTGEMISNRKNKEKFPAFLTTSLIKDETGNPTAIMCVLRDITELKKTEKLLRHEKEKIQKLADELKSAYKNLKDTQNELINREKLVTSGTLAAGVAHEIRNPLAVIGMTVQYLQTKLGSNDPRRELTDAIINKVEKLDRVTKELINYGKTINLSIRKHSLNKCVTSNISLIKSRCRLQRIKIVKEYSRIPLVEMDEEQMDKVFFNIFDNAVKAIPARGGVLTITTKYDEMSNMAVVKIHNTGHIINNKYLHHIFEPFFTMRKGEGTGLGLSIAQNVVLKHGGKIIVKNMPYGKGKGVVFTVRLPVSSTMGKRE